MSQPLDNQTASFYGRFVQAAYTMYANKNADPLHPEPDALPPGYELGAWIHMSDFVLNVTEPAFYGIVAHKINDPDSRIIAIRGTEGALEWIDDGVSTLVPFRQVPSAGRVACGFDKIYSTLKLVRYEAAAERDLASPAGPAAPQTFAGSFADQLDQLAATREAERAAATRSLSPAAPEGQPRARSTRPTVVAGHSLGSALATLFVMENASKKKFDITTLCTFASPRVGNMEFVHLFNQLPINVWRIVNTVDVVPKLPLHFPMLFDYGHVDVEYAFDSSSFTKRNLVCWHSMDTYLHWLDATHAVGPECCL